MDPPSDSKDEIWKNFDRVLPTTPLSENLDDSLVVVFQELTDGLKSMLSGTIKLAMLAQKYPQINLIMQGSKLSRDLLPLSVEVTRLLNIVRKIRQEEGSLSILAEPICEKHYMRNALEMLDCHEYVVPDINQNESN